MVGSCGRVACSSKAGRPGGGDTRSVARAHNAWVASTEEKEGTLAKAAAHQHRRKSREGMLSMRVLEAAPYKLAVTPLPGSSAALTPAAGLGPVRMLLSASLPVSEVSAVL